MKLKFSVGPRPSGHAPYASSQSDKKLISHHPTHQPLLSATEINELIQRCGKLSPAQVQHSNRNARFGEQPSRQLGSGMDFADRRAYQAGDDPRYIDWRASARSAHTLIKRFHSEVSHPGCVVIDRRASMAFGTRARLKATQALRAGITLGAQLLNHGSPLALLLLDQKHYWQPPQAALSALQRGALYAARSCPPQDHNPADSDWRSVGHSLMARLPQGSRLFLLSDFAGLDEAALKTLRQIGHYFDCRAIHIIDPVEHHLPAAAALSLHWDQQNLQPGPGKRQRQALQQALNQRQQQVQDWFSQSRCLYTRLGSEQSLDGLRA